VGWWISLALQAMVYIRRARSHVQRSSPIPAELKRQVDKQRGEHAGSAGERTTMRFWHKYLEGEEPSRLEELRAALSAAAQSRARWCQCCAAQLCATRACSPCLTRSWTYLPSPLDIPPVTWGGPPIRLDRGPQGVGTISGAILCPGFQDCERCLRWAAVLPARLFWPGEGWRHGSQCAHRAQAAAGAACCACTPTGARRST
jgi:hypothetical protein